MKKFLSFVLALALVFSLAACGNTAGNDDVYTVGICQLVQHEALDAATIIEKTIDETYEVTFEYLQMNAVMQTMKDPYVTILEQKSDLSCTIRFSVRRRESDRILQALQKVGTVRFCQ